MTVDEFEAFIALLYVRGTYNESQLHLDLRLSEFLGPPVLIETLDKKSCTEIMN